jgi:methyltransferase-like protein
MKSCICLGPVLIASNDWRRKTISIMSNCEVKVDASIHVKFAVVNMDGYETDEILSRALGLAEDVENDIIFITQSTFQNNESILHVLKKARNLANLKIYVKN